MQIEAAIFRKPHEPLTIETIDLDAPMAREVLVRTVATGVCHSDLHVVDGVGRWPSTGRSSWATRAPGWSRRSVAR